MAKRRWHRARIWYHTLRHLRVRQIAQRLRLRAQKHAQAAWPQLATRALRRTPGRDVGWPAGYRPVSARTPHAYPSAEANASGDFEFISIARPLGDPLDWQQAAAPELWTIHLHQFDWAWSFAAHPDRRWARDRFGELWRSWSDATAFGRWNAWLPFVAATRAWNLCGVFADLVEGGPLHDPFIAQLGLHAGYVRANLEYDVRGNHLVRDLKAAVGAGVMLDDPALVRVGVAGLEAAADVQVLADGGHYELSPSYHCQVLEDLADVSDLLHAIGRPSEVIDAAVEEMRAWLGAMLQPDGDVPLLNDCVLVGPERVRHLRPGLKPAGPLTVLPDSGYVVIRTQPALELTLDVGPPGPLQLPAHSHADCLSFVLAAGGRRLVVDAGTSTYEPGPWRAYERSTRAHNTIELDHTDQSETWGSFRMARRARARLERAELNGETVIVTAAHDGYRRLRGGGVHRRTWEVRDGAIRITDRLSGRSRHRVAWHLHLAPGLSATLAGTRVRAEALTVELPWATEVRIVRGQHDPPQGWAAQRFGCRRPAEVVVAVTERPLPTTLVTELLVTG